MHSEDAETGAISDQMGGGMGTREVSYRGLLFKFLVISTVTQ